MRDDPLKQTPFSELDRDNRLNRKERLIRAQVEGKRAETIEECAKFIDHLADRRDWSPGYQSSARKIAALVRHLALTSEADIHGFTMTDAEKQLAHKIIADLFDLPVRDMGGGLRIVSLPQNWCPVEERDLIVRALSSFTATEGRDE